MQLWDLPKRHPGKFAVLAFVFGTFPQWFQSIWSIFSVNAPAPAIAGWLRTMSFPVFSPYWITIPVCLATLIWMLYAVRPDLPVWTILSFGQRYVPLDVAARIAYELSRKDYDNSWARMADEERRRKGLGPESILDFMAGMIEAEFQIYGKHPPSTVLEPLSNLTDKRVWIFHGGAKTGGHAFSKDVYTDLAVTRKDLRAIKKYFEPED